MAGSEKAVAFYSSGLKLSGVLYLPATEPVGSHWPGIVLCNGFTSVKEMYLPEIGRAMAEEGFAALAFDYRGFGKSEGPAGRLNPEEQVEDVRNAITFLQAQSGIDAHRIGLYGTSFGGGIVIAAGAIDQRVHSVISSVPVCNGERWLRGMRSYWEWTAFRRELEADRQRRVVTGISERVDRALIAPPDPAARQAHAASPGRPKLPLETAEAIIEFNPEAVVERLSPRPFLMIVAGEDMRVPAEVSMPAFQRAREPKSLVVFEGAAHHDVYRAPLQDRLFEVVLSWLKKHGETPQRLAG